MPRRLAEEPILPSAPKPRGAKGEEGETASKQVAVPEKPAVSPKSSTGGDFRSAPAEAWSQIYDRFAPPSFAAGPVNVNANAVHLNATEASDSMSDAALVPSRTSSPVKQAFSAAPEAAAAQAPADADAPRILGRVEEAPKEDAAGAPAAAQTKVEEPKEDAKEAALKDLNATEASESTTDAALVVPHKLMKQEVTADAEADSVTQEEIKAAKATARKALLAVVQAEAMKEEAPKEAEASGADIAKPPTFGATNVKSQEEPRAVIL